MHDPARTYDDAFFDRFSTNSLASAQIILRTVFELVPVRSVVDVGCGEAPWLHTAFELGAVRGVGLDGDYIDRARLFVPADAFRACDLQDGRLASAVDAGETFDIAICVEVAEHLSATRAASFVAELCGLSDLVVFSAAIPGQGGYHHINEQWPAYWSDLFEASRFACFDVLRPSLWNEVGCEWWYLQNVLLFAKRGSQMESRLLAHGSPTSQPMALVHPRKMLSALAELRSNLDEAHRAAAAATDVANRQSEAREELASRLRAIESSRIWRATRPLRRLVSSMRGRQ